MLLLVVAHFFLNYEWRPNLSVFSAPPPRSLRLGG